MQSVVSELNKKLHEMPPHEVLKYFINEYNNTVAFGSSMGAEDQVLTHIITSISKNVKIFTLDTGRLFPSTYKTIDDTNKKYGISIKVYFPDNKQVEKMVDEKGINLFYDSIENRKLCCHVRKIEPLKRALKGMQVWLTGLRKDQSITRFYTNLVEWDEDLSIIKVNPLLNWTEKNVWTFIRENNIPYNGLHDKGFPSIGCQPCTRAINPGDDIRAGRWWWEAPENKECGLHQADK